LTNPSGRALAMGSTQPITDVSTRDISWGKGGRCVGLTTLPPSCVLKSWIHNLLEPSGPVQACNGIALTSEVVTTSLLSTKESAVESALRLCSKFILCCLFHFVPLNKQLIEKPEEM
jgi:hypothetical protein